MPVEPRSRPPGRRHNGLDAAGYAPVSDVDPRVGEHLLDLLYLAGIAAYLQPAVDLDAVTRAATLPAQPTDRLWVDRARTGEARTLVAAEAAAAGTAAGWVEPAHGEDGESAPASPDGRPAAPSPRRPATDEDRVWLEIVASFDREDAAPVPPWPVVEDADGSAPPPAADEPPRYPDLSGESEEDSYRPPPPPPLPTFSKGTRAALAVIAFGAAMLVAPGLLGLDAQLSLSLAILGFVVGVGALVWRMRDEPPDDGGPDDGAVV